MPKPFADLAQALRLLTTVPLPRRAPQGMTAAAAWAFPVAGVVVGAGVAAVAVVAAGLPESLRVVAVLAAWVAVTGGLHLDGVADVGDAGWAARTPAARHAILADPRLGSFGVLALLGALAAKGAVLWVGPPPALYVVAAIAPRALIVVAMALLAPHASSTMAAALRPGWRVAVVAVTVGVALLALVTGWLDLPPRRVGAAVVAAVLVMVTVLWWCRSRFAGVGGDALGAAIEAGEVAVLWLWVAA